MKEKSIVMRNRLLILLIASGLTFFICPFFANSFIFAFGITQFVIVVAGCTYWNLRGHSISEAVKHNDEQFDKAVAEKRPLAIFAYGAVIPALIWGLVWITIITVAVWFIKF